MHQLCHKTKQIGACGSTNDGLPRLQSRHCADATKGYLHLRDLIPVGLKITKTLNVMRPLLLYYFFATPYMFAPYTLKLEKAHCRRHKPGLPHHHHPLSHFLARVTLSSSTAHISSPSSVLTLSLPLLFTNLGHLITYHISSHKCIHINAHIYSHSSYTLSSSPISFVTHFLLHSQEMISEISSIILTGKSHGSTLTYHALNSYISNN